MAGHSCLSQACGMSFISHYSQSSYQETSRSELCSQDCTCICGEGEGPKVISLPQPRRCPLLSPAKEPVGSSSHTEIHSYLMTVPLPN